MLKYVAMVGKQILKNANQLKTIMSDLIFCLLLLFYVQNKKWGGSKRP